MHILTQCVQHWAASVSTGLGSENDQSSQDQENILRAVLGTVSNYFGSWETIFKNVTEPRNPELITYPLAELLFTGVLMFLCRLGARREINHKLRGNRPATAKFKALFGTDEIPHGDTLNYGFQRLDVDEVQEVECSLVETLIRKKVLYRWRLLGQYFLVAMDGTGMLTFLERHCEHCLTKKLNNGATLYYHPVLEAKLVTANGFAFSLMTEFIQKSDPNASKQDCELKAFYRLAARLKARFPRLWMCLLLDGLFASGPTLEICTQNDWKYLIVLRDDDLPSVIEEFEALMPLVPENNKQVQRGVQKEITQTYRWMEDIEYVDSRDHAHELSVVECVETKPDSNGETSKTEHKWLTNFQVTSDNVVTLANDGGRLRWKIENEGFNVQKNGGFNLEHAYSQDETASKVFYFLLQIAYLIFQLLEKGSLFRRAFPAGVGSLKNIAFRLLEAWRTLRLSSHGFESLYGGKYQIRFDNS